MFRCPYPSRSCSPSPCSSSSSPRSSPPPPWSSPSSASLSSSPWSSIPSGDPSFSSLFYFWAFRNTFHFFSICVTVVVLNIHFRSPQVSISNVAQNLNFPIRSNITSLCNNKCHVFPQNIHCNIWKLSLSTKTRTDAIYMKTFRLTRWLHGSDGSSSTFFHDFLWCEDLNQQTECKNLP